MMKCKVCLEIIPRNRAKLGFTTCIEHGGTRNKYPVAIPYNKGGYQLVTPKSSLVELGKK